MKQNASKDFFADIATAHYTSTRASLERPPAPEISELELAWNTRAPEPRATAPRIRTLGEMESALDGLREKFGPFLADLAPVLPDPRSCMEFTTFDWRIETPADQQNFLSVMEGSGSWESVNLPHYGPPLGKAATLYRCEFDLPAWAGAHDVLSLQFGGVDYRCQVYLNGFCIGTHEGFFEQFRFDCMQAAKPGKNILLVRVENDYTMLGENTGDIAPDGDKIYAATGLGYDDPKLGWHHCPAAMGIWNHVRLVGTSKLFIDELWVRPVLESEEIEICLEVESRSANLEEEVSCVASIFGQNFEQVVHMDHVHRGEADFVRGFGDLEHGFDQVFPSYMGSGRNFIKFRLPITAPRLWSPETPWLYQAQVRLLDADNNLLDTRRAQFGMRSFVQDETSTPKGKFYLNGDEVRLRGANTMGNFERCIMQGDFDGLRDQILLAKLTQMNFLRMTQRPVHREFYEYCDRLGMLTQTDLPMFSTVRRTQFSEVARQAGCMERHVRAHCSNVLVSFINEPRPAAASKPHRFIDRDEMEDLFDMCIRTVRYHNPDRVIKCVDGDYDPPTVSGMPDNHVYCGWYIGHGVDIGALHQGHWLPIKPGWHYGCGEFGAEGLDSYEVMMNEYPADWKPGSPDAEWSPSVIAMSQSHKFHYLWYDSANTAQGWIDASQDHQEWAIGLMARAYRRMSWMNTFAVHLFIDAWPAGWMKSLMDVYCRPKKAWFAYRDALTPLAVFLRSDRTQVWSGEQVPVEVWVCNDHATAFPGMKVQLELRVNGELVASAASSVDAPACEPLCLGRMEVEMPLLDARTEVRIGASLVDRDGRPVHDNTLDLAVFPRQQSAACPVCCLGEPVVVENYCRQLGLTPVDIDENPSTICVIGEQALAEHLVAVREAVKAGATAVVLGLTAGEYPLGPSGLTVFKAGMGPRHFVSQATGHPLVDGFEKNDFKFWYHGNLKRVGPILHTLLDAPGWSTILNSGDGGWTKPWDYVPAAAEVADGLGTWRVVQIELPECIQSNPVAFEFARRLLDLSTTVNPQTVHELASKS